MKANNGSNKQLPEYVVETARLFSSNNIRFLASNHGKTAPIFQIGSLILHGSHIGAPILSKLKGLTSPTKIEGQRVVKTRYGGSLITLSQDGGISSDLQTWHEREPLVTKMLTNVIEDDFFCLDIGANLGYYAILEAIRARKGFVIAIEPTIETAQLLEKNFLINNCRNYKVLQIAIAERDGEESFIVSKKSNLNRLASYSKNRLEDIVVVRTIQVKKLDSVVRSLGIKRLDLLRLDVEGSEASIYMGGREAISRYNPLIQVEIHVPYMGSEKSMRLIQAMHSDGYESFYCVPRGIDYSPFSKLFSPRKFSAPSLIGELGRRRMPVYFNMLAVPSSREVFVD